MGGKAILLVTIGFGLILSYISFNIAGMSTRAVTNMSDYAMATESHNLAVTGANVGLAKFYQDTSWFGTISQSFTGSKGSRGFVKGSFHVTMVNLGGERALCRSVSTYPIPGKIAIHDTVEIYFDTRKYNGYELFAWMSDFEGNMFWATGDTIWGRAHSNGVIHVNGSPVFMEKITTSKRFDPRPGVGANQAVYNNGYETGIGSIQIPPNFNELLNAANPLAGGTGRMYSSEIWVTLTEGTAANNDGMIYVRSSAGGPIIDSIRYGVDVFNGALVGTQDVHVQGTLDGELTIGSLDDIYVEDDILYANRDYDNSDDVLGLVTEDDVIIADNSANNTNCVIDGSIFCRDGSFMAENLSGRPVTGILETHGSIVMKERGAVAEYAGSNIIRGFAKRFYYDERLADGYFRPPFYPGYWVKTYAIANWWENIRIPEYSY